MICQKCKKAAAAVCISQHNGGEKTDIYLCQSCANESAAVALKAAFGLLDMMPSKFAFAGELDRYSRLAGNTRCLACAKTFAEIQQDGKVGCARCYVEFRDRLRPIVERIHRSATHKGHCPSSAPASYVAKRKIMELKAELEKAVAGEEYEKAAELRDLIKNLEVGKR